MTDHPTEEQIAKLPVWARSYVQELRGQIEGLANIIDGLSNAQDDATPFAVGKSYSTGRKVALNFSVIEFPAFGIAVNQDSYGRLRIATQGRIAIFPTASNCFTVEGETQS